MLRVLDPLKQEIETSQNRVCSGSRGLAWEVGQFIQVRGVHSGSGGIIQVWVGGGQCVRVHEGILEIS